MGLREEVKQAAISAVRYRGHPTIVESIKREDGRDYITAAAVVAALAVLDGYEEVPVEECGKTGGSEHWLRLPDCDYAGSPMQRVATRTIYMKKAESETLTVDREAYARLIEEAESPTPSQEHEAVITKARKALT